jgi:membrane protein implicated in regulation of membrane protease activity
VAPGRRPPITQQPEASCTAAWTLVGVLLAFKAVTITLIFLAARPSDNPIPMLLAMNWPWLIVLGLLISVIPIGFWIRLLRARARRRQLQRSEWNV